MPFLVNLNVNSQDVASLLQPTSLATSVPDLGFVTSIANIPVNPGPVAGTPGSGATPAPPVEYPSVPELLGLHYVGYQIEKQRFDLNNRVWLPFEDINIFGRLTNKHNDKLIAYSQIYRYRAFSCAKYTYSGSSIFLTSSGLVGAVNNNPSDSLETNTSIRSVYFRSDPSRWFYILAKESVPPPPPDNFNIFPKTNKNQIILVWNPGANPQRDTKLYFVFRRKFVTEPWKIVASELPLSENIFVDEDVKLGEKYIYTIQSEDAHGFRSKLSTQLQAELNSDFHCEQKEIPIKFISEPGTVLDLPHLIINGDTINPFEEIVARKNIKISPNISFEEDQKDFILRITSLDTMKSQDLKLILKNKIENS